MAKELPGKAYKWDILFTNTAGLSECITVQKETRDELFAEIAEVRAALEDYGAKPKQSDYKKTFVQAKAASAPSEYTGPAAMDQAAEEIFGTAKTCPVCGDPMKKIENRTGALAKTGRNAGKPWSDFWVCDRDNKKISIGGN